MITIAAQEARQTIMQCWGEAGLHIYVYVLNLYKIIENMNLQCNRNIVTCECTATIVILKITSLSYPPEVEIAFVFPSIVCTKVYIPDHLPFVFKCRMIVGNEELNDLVWGQ